MTSMNLPRTLLCLTIFLGWTAAVLAMDQVTFRHKDREMTLSGRVLITAEDGGLLLQGRDGVIWAIQPDELIKQTSDDDPFEPFTRDEMAKSLLAELPKNFEVLHTKHYLICYDTSRTYAQWAGSLFERLYMAFTNYWSHKGFRVGRAGVSPGGNYFRRQAGVLEVYPNRLGRGG